MESAALSARKVGRSSYHFQPGGSTTAAPGNKCDSPRVRIRDEIFPCRHVRSAEIINALMTARISRFHLDVLGDIVKRIAFYGLKLMSRKSEILIE
ncbi:Hypothetical protein NTJ_05864 [Nesidiocoris tenuis]|uniref:Uncharacterized protein n=1 Tax=Nesidiocoris tenuis TaxID=355587 RepID=A0ABN7ALE5_9HEMI|nr:Hypothetical protein NTJ_05864 [Nesidiocoris tenuis]